MTPAMQEITSIIEAGAAAAMNLEEIIMQEISDWESSELKKLMVTGQEYYEGDTAIKERERKTIGQQGRQVKAHNLADNRITHNFVRKLVDQKVGYLLSKPMSVQTNNGDYQEELSHYFDKKTLRLIQTVGKEAINKGKGWIQVYYNEDGELSFKKIPSEQVIPLWRDAAHSELDALIRQYEVEAYEGRSKKTITKVEYWDKSGVRRYILDAGKLIPDVETPAGEYSGHFTINKDDEETPVNWQRIPFICVKYNEEELPLIKFLKDLVDDYDKQKSDNSNNLEDLPNSIFVVKNFSGTEGSEFRENIAAYRVVFTSTDGGVETISLEINTEAYKTHMDMNRRDIYEFGRGVDTQSEKMGADKSGIALKFLYADLDMDANGIETEYQASLEQLLWFIDQHVYNTAGQDYSNEKVDFIFNRDIIINETEAITNVRNSVGILSDETLVSNHPWTTNTKDELDRRKEEFGHFGLPDDPRDDAE